MSKWRTHGKTIVAVALAIFTALQASIPDHHVNNTELIQILISFFTALSVYLVPVVPTFKWVKTAIAAILSVLQVLVTLAVDGWQVTDWMPLVIAVVTAVAVGLSPAVSETHPPTEAQP